MAASTRSGSSSLVNVLPPEASAVPSLSMATRLMKQPADRSSRTTVMIGFIGASLILWHNQVLGLAEQEWLVLLSATAADRHCSVDRLLRRVPCPRCGGSLEWGAP